MGADLQEERGAFPGLGFVGEDADGAVGLEAVEDARTGTHAHPQPFVADGHPPIGADLEWDAAAPDVGPPGTAWHRAQDAAFFALRGARGRVGRALEFAMDFVGVAVAAQIGQEGVGGFGVGNGFGGEEGGQAALPVLVLPFDLALGLGRARVAQRDAIEVERGPELGQRVWALGKKQAVAIDIKFEGQTVLGEGGGQEVEVGEQIFAGINSGSGADARAVIQEVQKRIVSFISGEPAMGRGVELPEGADFQALPAAQRSGRTWGREWMVQVLCDGPATHGGGINEEAQPTMDFGGGAAIRGGRFGREQLAQERCGAVRPVGSVITPGGSRHPAVLVVVCDAPQIIAVEFVEAGAAQAELVRSGEGGDFIAAESGEDFTDQRSTQTVRELTIMFFIAARMAKSAESNECNVPAQRA